MSTNNFKINDKITLKSKKYETNLIKFWKLYEVKECLKWYVSFKTIDNNVTYWYDVNKFNLINN